MTEQPSKQPLAAIETDLFGGIMEFYTKTTALLRESSLDDDKRKVVVDRIKALLDDATADMKAIQQPNLSERLEAAYKEAKRLVDELSASQDAGKAEKSKKKKGRAVGRKNTPRE
jgi:uncharacterized membrane protein YukC